MKKLLCLLCITSMLGATDDPLDKFFDTIKSATDFVHEGFKTMTHDLHETVREMQKQLVESTKCGQISIKTEEDKLIITAKGFATEKGPGVTLNGGDKKYNCLKVIGDTQTLTIGVSPYALSLACEASSSTEGHYGRCYFNSTRSISQPIILDQKPQVQYNPKTQELTVLLALDLQEDTAPEIVPVEIIED